MLTVLYNTFTPLALIVLTVIIASRHVQFDPRTFSRGTIYLFSPCLVLQSMLTTQLSASEMSRVILATLLCGLLIALLATAIARALRYPRQLAGTFIATAIIMNGLNFGIPFIEFAFGPQAYDRAVLFNVGQILVVYTLGIYVISRGTTTVRHALKNIITIPMPYAFLLGILLNLLGWQLPLPAQRAISVLAQATVPCALVILGLQLKSAHLNGRWQPILTATATRYILGATLAITITALLGLDGLTRQVYILQYSTPIGVSSGVLATEFNGDAEFAAAAILFSTLISIIPLSLLMLLVGGI